MVRSGPRSSSGANCSVQLHHDDDEDDHSYNADEEDNGDDNNFHKLSNQ